MLTGVLMFVPGGFFVFVNTQIVNFPILTRRVKQFYQSRVNNFSAPEAKLPFRKLFLFYSAIYRLFAKYEVEGEPHTPNTEPRMEKI